MNTYMTEFNHYLTEKIQLSNNTISSYHLDLRKFFDYLSDRQIDDMGQVSTADLYAYRVYLKEQSLKNTTINRYLASLRRYFSFLHTTGRIQANPTLEIKGLRQRRKQQKVLSYEELCRVLDSETGETSMALRDAAIVEMLYATGMKATEIVALDRGDVDLESGTVAIDDRRLPLHDRALSLLSAYLESHRLDADQPLFINYQGDRLTRQSLWKITKERGERHGIGNHLTPNTIRNSLRQHLEDGGAPKPLVDYLMGFDTEALDADGIIGGYMMSHPRA